MRERRTNAQRRSEVKLKIDLKYTGQAVTLINEAAKQCNMTVDDFAYRAVLLMVRQGFEEGKRQTELEARKATDEQHNPVSTVPSGISEADISVPSSGSNALPNTQTSTIV